MCLLVHAISAMSVSNEGTPQWGIRYQVSGTLRLPYAQIEEPFFAWYDATKNRSRVDFYGGKLIL